MKTKVLALFLLAGSSMFAGARVFVGVGFGGPSYGYYAAPPPAPVVSYAAQYRGYAPGPDYAWVGGSYYPYGSRWAWRSGYWGHRPYAGAYWAAPRYYGHRYYSGYWRR